jgi:chromosome partitioning protein
MKILSVASPKGGVGKSTLVIHIAHCAAELGLRVLLVDMDKQASLSFIFSPVVGCEPGLLASSLFNNEITTEKPEYLSASVAIIRGDERLGMLEGNQDLIRRPALQLRRFSEDFDLCIIDTPGANGTMLNAALTASDAVICPVAVGLLENAALAALWKFIKAIKTKGYNPRLQVMGMIPSKINTKSKEELSGLDELRTQFGDAILPFMLAERAAVKQAVSRRRPVWLSPRGDGHKKAAVEWLDACKSILTKLGSIK